MALDKLVDSTQLDSDLTSVANAIRAKSGGSSQLAFPAGFVSEIQAIPSGGGGSHYQFTQAEAWTSDAKGNTQNFYNTYLSSLFSGVTSGVAYGLISNNTASGYPANYFFRQFSLTNKTSWMRNNLSSSMLDAGSTSSSFYISAGATIDIYLVP